MGLRVEVAEHRKKVLTAAFEAHPERFVRGVPSPPAVPTVVWINPPVESGESKKGLQ